MDQRDEGRVMTLVERLRQAAERHATEALENGLDDFLIELSFALATLSEIVRDAPDSDDSARLAAARLSMG
jgi:hypothetical protein